MTESNQDLETRLKQAFSPLYLKIEDESGQHRGHVGASGGGHFAVTLVAEAFAGKTLVEQHRMVNEVVGELFQGRVHALALKTYSPEQWQKMGN